MKNKSQNKVESTLEYLKKSLKVPIKELKITQEISFLVFQIGAEPYYIKVMN